MLDFDHINYWAVAVAWIITVVIGAFWYSPAGFGKQWIKMSGVNHLEMPANQATKALGFIAVSALVQVQVLAIVVNSLQVTNVVHALIVGTVLWLGLTAATTVGNALYQRLGWKFWWLNGSYFLLVTVISSIIFAMWR